MAKDKARAEDKIINFRPFLIVLCFAAAGILFALLTCYALPLGIALLASMFALGLLLAVRAATLKNSVGIFTFILALAAAAFVVSAFFLTLSRPIPADVETTLTGRVTEKSEWSDGDYTVVLDDLRMGGKTAAGQLRLTIYDADQRFYEIGCGYRVGVTASVNTYPIVSDVGVNASSVRSDVRYFAYCETSDVFGVETGVPSPLEYARDALRLKLTENMGELSGSIAYGMIVGDRNYIDDDIEDAYSKTGIGHILAVSGLHIGLICYVLTRLFSHLPLPKNASRAVISLLLLAYVVFVGASPSAVRAFVMCFIMLWSKLFGRRDSLNALCLAAIVCLCISPFYLFECGFLMSFSAMLGLIFFARTFTDAFSRLRLPRSVASALGSSLAVQLAITPVTAFFFHRFYFWSFIVNALFLWLLSAAFMLMIAVLPFALIPALGFLLVPFGLWISGMTQLCFFVAGLPLAVTVIQVSATVFSLIPLAFALSRFVMLKHKRAVNLLLIGMGVAVAFGSENSFKSESAMLAIGGRTLTAIYSADETYIVGGFGGKSAVSALDASGIGGGEFILYADRMTENAAANIIELAALRKIKEVRFPESENVGGIKTLTDAGIAVTAVGRTDGVFDAVDSGGWLYTARGRTIYITSGMADPSVAYAADVVRCSNVTETVGDALYITARATDMANAVHAAYGAPYVYEF